MAMSTVHLLATTAEPAEHWVPWGIGWLRELMEWAGTSAAPVPWTTLWLVQLFVVCCVATHLLERYGPRVIERQPPGPFHRGWFADLVGAVVDGPVLSVFTDILAVTLILQVPALTGGMGAWPVALQFALYFVGNDFGRYWLHRWFHESNFLWRFHRVHHSCTQMSVLANFRMHAFEAIPKYALLVLPFKLFGVSGGVVLGYAALDLVKGFWHHANLRTPIGRGNLVLNSAEQHWWHHSVEARGQYANYGSVLSIWDRLFGTFYWPRGQWPDRIGVQGIDSFPETYLGRFVSMFRSDEAFADRRAANAVYQEMRRPDRSVRPTGLPDNR